MLNNTRKNGGRGSTENALFPNSDKGVRDKIDKLSRDGSRIVGIVRQALRDLHELEDLLDARWSLRPYEAHLIIAELVPELYEPIMALRSIGDVCLNRRTLLHEETVGVAHRQAFK
ncbi:MAG: hypothetical protein MPJ50_19235 [Pirellulales bacterium]|nr:hypothetical protein [Pirellulales bacterium]